MGAPEVSAVMRCFALVPAALFVFGSSSHFRNSFPRRNHRTVSALLKRARDWRSASPYVKKCIPIELCV